MLDLLKETVTGINEQLLEVLPGNSQTYYPVNTVENKLLSNNQ